jgi:ABC-2 type transport system ATP-binding protein
MITIDNLSKHFRKTEAVSDLSLTVPEGQVTAFLGPNGAGKSTTIKCLLNLHRPDSGQISVMGTDSRKLGPQQFTHIGYVSENMELPLWMTVKQFLDYCRPMYPQWDKDFEAKLMRQFELPLQTRLKDLSRGMRMKAALLSSLAYRPKLIVLDEPFSGLDPLVRDEFICGLLELTEQEGWTVFVSSHDIEEVQRLADRIAIINSGKLALDETSESLQARFRAVEVVLPEGEPLPTLPASCILAEQAGRIYRYIETAYTEGQQAPYRHHRAMSLREIFISLARAYRLEGK